MSRKYFVLNRASWILFSVGLALIGTSLLIVQASRLEPSVRLGGEEQKPNGEPLEPGEVQGTVIYSGGITGTHLVWVGAFTTTQGGPPAFSITRSGPGSYTLTNILQGVYTISGGMDADDTGGPPDPAIDPLGSYAHNPVTVTAGTVITGVDFILLDPVPPPTQTGSITGQISYSGSVITTHQIIVFASRMGSSGPPAYSTVISSVGQYNLTNVAAYSYTVGAFMDLGDDMGPPQPNEPFGWYDLDKNGLPDPVVVNGSGAVTGIDIALLDPRWIINLPLIFNLASPLVR